MGHTKTLLLIWIGEGKKNYSEISHFINGPVQHLDYTVRTDLLEEMDRILGDGIGKESNQATPKKSHLYHEEPKFIPDPVDIHRAKDAVHFWNDAEAKGENVLLRNGVNRALRSLKDKHPELIIDAEEAGSRGSNGRNSPQEDYARALLEYKIVIVCQRDSHETHYRLMEALISGAMVMTDYAHYFPEGIEDGHSIVVYKSFNDLQGKVMHYLSHDAERKRIARNGRNTMLEQHRSWHWLEGMVFDYSI